MVSAPQGVQDLRMQLMEQKKSPKRLLRKKPNTKAADKRGALVSKLSSEESDFKIAMRRRGKPAGASLDEMAKKYGL